MLYTGLRSMGPDRKRVLHGRAGVYLMPPPHLCTNEGKMHVWNYGKRPAVAVCGEPHPVVLVASNHVVDFDPKIVCPHCLAALQDSNRRNVPREQ